MKIKSVKIVSAMAVAVALMFGSFVSCGNGSHDSVQIDQDTEKEDEGTDDTPPHPAMTLTKRLSQRLKAVYQ